MLDETHKATFDAAPDWVDAFLALTCEPPHCAMLRAARAESRALLLIDGLDEAGKERARIDSPRVTVRCFAQTTKDTLPPRWKEKQFHVPQV